jgi:hypothetical protein
MIITLEKNMYAQQKNYRVLIGGYTEESAHSEMEVKSVNEAIIYLHVFARKNKPEMAMADIGDYRGWVSNQGLEKQPLDNFPHSKEVERLIREENIQDEELEVHSPDITILPSSPGFVMVSSTGMKFEMTCSISDLPKLISDLCLEFTDLVHGDILSRPAY